MEAGQYRSQVRCEGVWHVGRPGSRHQLAIAGPTDVRLRVGAPGDGLSHRDLRCAPRCPSPRRGVRRPPVTWFPRPALRVERPRGERGAPEPRSTWLPRPASHDRQRRERGCSRRRPVPPGSPVLPSLPIAPAWGAKTTCDVVTAPRVGARALSLRARGDPTRLGVVSAPRVGRTTHGRMEHQWLGARPPGPPPVVASGPLLRPSVSRRASGAVLVRHSDENDKAAWCCARNCCLRKGCATVTCISNYFPLSPWRHQT